jgi:large subunit ribosomal protein L29
VKAKKMRDLTSEELQQKHDDLLADHFKLRVKHTLGQLENPLELRAMRRDIARAKTLLREYGVVLAPRRRRTTTAAKMAPAKAVKAKAKKSKPAAEKD